MTPPDRVRTLSLCMIVKNEEAVLAECLARIKPFVNEMIIVDTGSTDATREIAAAAGARVIEAGPDHRPEFYYVDDERTVAPAPPPYTGQKVLGDFAGVRNVGIDQATCDYVMWLDADDLIEGAEHLPRTLADMEKGGAETAWMQYLYSFDAFGNCICRLWRERLVLRGTARFVNPIHEVMNPAHPEKQAKVRDIVVRHRRPQERSATGPLRNFKVLVQHLRRRPNDARTLFYYANEAQHFDVPRAIWAYEQYLELSKWNEERAIARVSLGQLYEARGQYAKAFAQYAGAAAEDAKLPEGWFALAHLAYVRGDWRETVRFTEEGFKRGDPDGIVMVNPAARTFMPHVFYSVALNQIGRVREALESGAKALEFAPGDPGLQRNMEAFRRHLDASACLTTIGKEAVAVALAPPGPDVAPAEVSGDLLERMALHLWKELVRAGDAERAGQLLAALPAAIEHLPGVAAARDKTQAVLAGPPPEMPQATQQALRAYYKFRLQERADVSRSVLCIGDAIKDFRAAAVADRITHGELTEWGERWDTIVMAGELEHVYGVDHLLKEVWEALRFNGRLVVIAAGPRAAGEAWDGPRAGLRRYTPARLMAALQTAGFHVDDCYLDQGNVVASARAQAPRRLLDVVFWTGPAVEPWNPRTPATSGIGGSETACIEMARELARLGHQVLVYADCGAGEGVYDGVEYRRYQRWAGAKCDVFVSSRQPAAVDQVEARIKLLWVHDVHVGQPDPNIHRWLLKYDRILALTKWHKNTLRQFYSFLHADRIIVTRNGLDPARFAGELVPALASGDKPSLDLELVERLPEKTNKLIFSSSANRGLDVMLDLLPQIRAQVPDAELHVFYGFESWEATAKMMRNAGELAQIEGYKKRLLSTPGVVWHGRVDQKTLAREMMTAKVWSYPTAFTETYCISALEAQAAGCVPVTTNLAGLAETAVWGLRIGGSNQSPAYHSLFVEGVVKLLTDEDHRTKIAACGREWALTQSWRELAFEWAAMFGVLIDEVEADPVPRYVAMNRLEAVTEEKAA